MALIVEDGTGVANAESLASVAFADTYHANRGNIAWGDIADVATKEQLLRKATDYAVAKYAGLWAGVPVSEAQFLPFPRTVNGTNIGLPVSIQQAIAELALSAKTSPLMPNIVRGKKKVKVGPIEVEYDGNSAVATTFVAASLRFAPFLSGVASGAMVKLVRT